ncbi:putative minor capsid protein [Oceanobacillus sp. CF4.6]|uniref:putative minor capsid protein n=1 Tax=Oceanobacillus sp. CF4.6 TaxID=3373080 RepID=UPI003EE5BCE9
MVRAIPKKLLIHNVDYEKNLGDDGWDSTYDEPIAIENVRVEATSRLQRGSNSEGTAISHVLIVDRKHSTVFPDFKPGDRVIFREIPREVVDVKPFYAFGPEIHHYEIELN